MGGGPKIQNAKKKLALKICFKLRTWTREYNTRPCAKWLRNPNIQIFARRPRAFPTCACTRRFLRDPAASPCAHTHTPLKSASYQLEIYFSGIPKDGIVSQITPEYDKFLRGLYHKWLATKSPSLPPTGLYNLSCSRLFPFFR